MIRSRKDAPGVVELVIVAWPLCSVMSAVDMHALPGTVTSPQLIVLRSTTGVALVGEAELGFAVLEFAELRLAELGLTPAEAATCLAADLPPVATTTATTATAAAAITDPPIAR